MDSYLLRAAALYGLSAAARTRGTLDDFPRTTTSSNAHLDSIIHEIFDLKVPLERLGDPDLVTPRQLQHPTTKLVRCCVDVLSRIDDWGETTPRDTQWAVASPDLIQLQKDLCTSRRALQLALEALSLVAAEDDTSEDIFGAYLDHDTSRILSLLRRTLQQIQQDDRDDDLKQALKSALDEIRLYIQSKCRGRDDTRSGPGRLAEMRAFEASGEPDESAPITPTGSERSDNVDSSKSANKLAKAIARLSLNTPRTPRGFSLLSLQSSFSRPSSERSMDKTSTDGSTSVGSGTWDTNGQARASVSSRPSSLGSNETSGPVTKSPAFTPSLGRKHTQLSPLSSMNEVPITCSELEAETVSGAVNTNSHDRDRLTPSGTRLPLFAISPTEKIVIDSSDVPARYGSSQAAIPPPELKRINLLANTGKGKELSHGSPVYFADMSPSNSVLASKYGDKTIRICGLPQSDVRGSLKVNFYLQMRERSREFFVTSHAILSEADSLIAVATGFGDTLEIWNWTSKKRLQVIQSVYRWAGARKDLFDTAFPPLACYREAEDSIYLFPVSKDRARKSNSAMEKPLGEAAVIRLAEAGFLQIPKLPEMVYSVTAPLLVAAAGPRPPRLGHPPPEHAAMLMVWDLASYTTEQSSRPCRASLPTRYTELETSLPCGLATHGSIVISIWIPHNVRVIGRPGAWQVEPVTTHERHVLKWDFDTGETELFSIPNENTITCISPDCRYVAYRQGPGPDTKMGRDVCLVILDALHGGREVWRTPTSAGGSGLVRDCDQLMDLSRITFMSFSLDGSQFIVGDANGTLGIYEFSC